VHTRLLRRLLLAPVALMGCHAQTEPAPSEYVPVLRATFSHPYFYPYVGEVVESTGSFILSTPRHSDAEVIVPPYLIVASRTTPPAAAQMRLAKIEIATDTASVELETTRGTQTAVSVELRFDEGNWTVTDLEWMIFN
jgi:hypothetical protein